MSENQIIIEENSEEKSINSEQLVKVTEASKNVFEKSINLACAVIENLDRFAWMGVGVLATAGGIFGSVEIVGNIMNDPLATKMFGDGPQLARILSSVGMAATSGLLLQMSKNGMQRNKDIFDFNS